MTRRAPAAGMVEYRSVRWCIVGVVVPVAFEAFAVSTALPSALRELHGIRAYGPTFGAYLAASLLASVIAGDLCDRHGPLLPFVCGVASFTGGLLVTGTAPNVPVFLAGRATQGLGAGLMVVVVYVVIARLLDQRQQPKALAAMASAWVLPSILGPPTGGLVAQWLGWRWVFLLIPFILLPSAALLSRHLRHPLVRPALGNLDRASGGLARHGRRPDLIVAAFGTAAGAGVAQYAVQRGAGMASLVAATIAGVLLLPTVPRLLPAGTLRARPGIPSAVLIRGLLAGAFFGAEILLPLVLITHLGFPPWVAGMVLAAGSVGWAAGSWLRGHRIGASPHFVAVSAAVLTSGIALLAVTLVLPVAIVAATVGWLVAGVGMGAGLTGANHLVLRLSGPDEQGRNSAALQISDSLGSITTTGLGGAVVALGASGGGPDSPHLLLAIGLMGGVAAVAALTAATRL